MIPDFKADAERLYVIAHKNDREAAERQIEETLLAIFQQGRRHQLHIDIDAK